MRRAAVEISSTRSSSESATAGLRTFVPSRRLSQTRSVPRCGCPGCLGRRAVVESGEPVDAVEGPPRPSPRWFVEGTRPSAHERRLPTCEVRRSPTCEPAHVHRLERTARPASSCATWAVVSSLADAVVQVGNQRRVDAVALPRPEPFSAVAATPPPRSSARAAPNSAQPEGTHRTSEP